MPAAEGRASMMFDTIQDEKVYERGRDILEIFAESQAIGHAHVEKIVAKYQERKGRKSRAYYEANRDDIESRRRERRAAARPPRPEVTPAEREAKREQRRAYNRAYKKANQDKARAARARYRAKKKAAACVS
jgi:hypothetical protein